MISALILSGDDPPALGATLATLVSGVAEGVVADAVIVARAPDDVTAEIAEAAGAAYAVAGPGETPWLAGARLARRDWLLLLEAGDAPTGDWARAVDRFAFMADADGERPIGRLDRRADGLLAALAGLVGRRAPTPRAGDLVHRAVLEGAARPRVARIRSLVVRETLDA